MTITAAEPELWALDALGLSSMEESQEAGGFITTNLHAASTSPILRLIPS